MRNTAKAVIFIILLLVGSIILLAISPMIIPIRIPVIRYGQFDYSLEYEIDGKPYTTSGTIENMYTGLNRSGHYSLKWSIDVDADNYDKVYNRAYLGKNKNNYSLYLKFPPHDGYFLKDPNDFYDYSDTSNTFSYKPWIETIDLNTGNIIEIDDIVNNEYGIRVIKWECDKPKDNLYIPYSDPLFIILIIAIMVFVKRKKRKA